MLFLAIFDMSMPASASGQDDLQSLLDGKNSNTITRASENFAEIDLSAYSAPITSTLYVRNQNVRFVNGTLTRDASINGPLIIIQNGYKLELPATATLSGNNTVIGQPVVEVWDGSLIVNGGNIIETVSSGPTVLNFGSTLPPDETLNSDRPVRLTSEESHIIMSSGTIEGEITCDAKYADVQLLGGNINFTEGYHVTSQSNVHLNPNTCNLIYTTKGKRMYLRSAITDSLRVDFNTELAVGDCVVEGENYTITQADVEKLSMRYGFWEEMQIYLYSNRRDIPPGYTYRGEPIPFKFVLKDNRVYLDEPENPIVSVEDVEPGTLPDRISNPEIVEELTLTGKLNGTDIVLLQNMAKMKLRRLDISGCDIVSGGSAYYTTSAPYSTNYYTSNDEIGHGMFYQSTSLKTVILPNSIKKIDGSSFHYGSVESITIGPKVTSIIGGLCPGTELKEIVLNGNSLFVFSDNILYDSKRTTIYRAVVGLSGHVIVPNSVSVIENSAFHYCALITKVTLPSQLNEIETACFSQCKSLLEIVFNNNLAHIGYNSFSGCEALENVDLSGTKVSYIEQSFYGCSNIQTLTLPKTLETIWGTCFTSTKLTEINCQATTPPTLSNADNTFRYDYIKNTCKLIVPKNTVSLYKAAAGWKEFYNITDNSLDYNNITNEDDLQKALDEIAAQKPSTPVEVTINPDGITLTHAISAKAFCNAIITGGTISVGGVTSYGEALSGADFMFLVDANATLRFQNIAIDFMQLRLKTVFWNNGTLYINDNVEYLHVIEDVVHDWGYFYLNRGGLWLNSGSLPHINGYVLNNGGIMDTSTALTTLYGNLFDNPRVHHTAGAVLLFNSALETIWTFEGNWVHYMLEQPFIMGGKTYTLQASDYWQMRFTGLPSTEYHRTVYYDGSSHSIKLKNYNCLQCMMDGDEDGNVDIPCDGVDVGENYTPAQRMQWLLDGGDCPSASFDPPTIWLPGGCMFLESPTIARFVTFDSFSSGHRLYIRNKTEFKDKVVARNFIWFSIIEQGGHLIWDNAETENVLYPIYNTGGTAEVKGGNLTGTVYNAGTLILCGCVQVNEIQVLPQSIIRVTSPITSTWVLDLTVDETVDYPNGCILLEGGNGYTLTADDFAHLQFRLPAGCSVTYDPTHNIVLLDSASDIHNIQADPTATHKGVYTLDGRKLQGQAKVKGVYIVNGQKAVVK